MPTKCDECGEESYCIFITDEYKKLCDDCYDEIRPAKERSSGDLLNGSAGPYYRY